MKEVVWWFPVIDRSLVESGGFLGVHVLFLFSMGFLAIV